MEFRDLKRQYQVLKNDIDSGILSVIESARFVSGPQVKKLEEEIAEYINVRHCITCANGTDAITLGMMALGIGSGDAVFVPDFTFFSSGECPAIVGATPVFVDVREDTYNINPVMLEKEVERVIADGQYNPKAVVAVDLFGQPAEYDELRRICVKYNMHLLEDSAQGFGGAIEIGSNNRGIAGSFGDISTTSFFPAKPLGCYGDGGAIFTDNDEWADLIRSLAVHGKAGNDKYNNIRIGMNSRLDTLQAAVLLPKFSAFKSYEVENINQVAAWYNEYLKITKLGLPNVLKGYRSSWAQYTVRLPEGVDRTLLQDKLKKEEIPTMVYYMKPMHQQEAFSGTYSSIADCPVTESLCRRVLSLPIHPYMTKDEVKFVSEHLIKNLEVLL